jgi:diadenosine tetraphosphate (Ap4A) HIT family hydrolase
MADCFSCAQNALDPMTLPPREAVYDSQQWRVAHSFNSALPGWLVLVARRHVTSLSQLTLEEAAGLGPLLRAISQALEDVLGAAKAYVIFLAEAEGFSHLHIHLIPRAADLPADRRGPAIFTYLKQAEPAWVPAAEMDALALRLRPLIESEVARSAQLA